MKDPKRVADGKKGGKKTLALYGKKHFSAAGKKSWKSRKIVSPKERRGK